MMYDPDLDHNDLADAESLLTDALPDLEPEPEKEDELDHVLRQGFCVQF